MAQKGFTLLECAVYSAILALLSLLVFQFFIVSYQRLSGMSQTGQQLMALYAVHDLLVRDIQAASPMASQWNFSDGGDLICQCGQGSIGWAWNDGNLYRMMGDYDFVHKLWNKKSKALVAIQVSEFTYKPLQADETITALKISLRMDALAECLEKIVPLYNRAIR